MSTTCFLTKLPFELNIVMRDGSIGFKSGLFSNSNLHFLMFLGQRKFELDYLGCLGCL